MKILFPIGIFYPATVGGPSSTLYWHSCYLQKNNFECYVVTTNLKLEQSDEIHLNKWLFSKAGNVIYCKTRNQYFPFKAILETIKKIKYVDIVHYSSMFHVLTIYTIFLSIFFKKKVFLSPRGELFTNAIGKSNLKKIVINLYRIVSKSITFHVTSKIEYTIVKNLFPKSKIVIQPNFIDIKTSKKSTIKSKDIVFLGIIYKVKKIENLIKAVSYSNLFRNSDSQLLIAGKPLLPRDFYYQDQLKLLISSLGLNEKIKFIGEIFYDQKERFLNNAYVLVLPSQSENFGNVVTEALSQSTPVISSIGTPWSILNETNAGWWVDNDPIILSKTIDEALSLSEEKYLEKCNNALNLVNERFNINTSLDNNWVSIYKDNLTY